MYKEPFWPKDILKYLWRLIIDFKEASLSAKATIIGTVVFVLLSFWISQTRLSWVIDLYLPNLLLKVIASLILYLFASILGDREFNSELSTVILPLPEFLQAIALGMIIAILV